LEKVRFKLKSVVNNCFHHTFSPSKLQIVNQFSYFLEIHVLIKKLEKDSFNYVVYFSCNDGWKLQGAEKKHYQQVLWILWLSFEPFPYILSAVQSPILLAFKLLIIWRPASQTIKIGEKIPRLVDDQNADESQENVSYTY
jgi:hypothetical protein